MLISFFLLCVVLVGLVTIHKITPLRGSSPLLFLPLFYIAIASAGYYVSQNLSPIAGGASIAITLTQHDATATLNLLMLGAIGVVLGGLVYVRVVTPVSTLSRVPDVSRSDLPSRPISLCAIPLLLLIVAEGPGNLWSRSAYIPENLQGSSLLSLGTVAGAVALLALGINLGHGDKIARSIILASGYELVFLGLGSRQLALVPLLLFVGYTTGNAKLSRAAKITLPLIVVACVLSVKVALFLRMQAEHGLSPYLSALHGDPTASRVAIGQVFNNLLVSFPLIGATAFQVPAIPASSILTSLNPAPGQLAGWYSLAPTLRFNRYTPYAGFGELANTGPLLLFSYLTGVGLILGWLQARALKMRARGLHVVPLALQGLVILFALASVQYNLRSATRFLYFAVALAVFGVAFAVLRAKSRASERAHRASCAGTAHV